MARAAASGASTCSPQTGHLPALARRENVVPQIGQVSVLGAFLVATATLRPPPGPPSPLAVCGSRMGLGAVPPPVGSLVVITSSPLQVASAPPWPWSPRSPPSPQPP